MIKFRMFGMHIDQFAILSKSAPLEDLGLGVNLNYKYANKGRIISCSTEFNFLNSAQEKIMILAITCEFDIEENDYLPITLQSSIVRLSSEKVIPTNTFPRLSSAKAAAYFLFPI